MSSLVPLRIPSRWAVIRNHFVDEDPVIRDGRFVNNEYFTQDVLSIETLRYEPGRWVNNRGGHIIDLGWYPDSDPNGQYRFVLLRGDWDNVIAQIESRDRQVIRLAIENAMEMVRQGIDDAEISRSLLHLASGGVQREGGAADE